MKATATPPDDTHAWHMFTAWLEGMTCTAPFTLADVAALYRLIKDMCGANAVVDVSISPRGDRVIVRVDKREWVLNVA